MVVRHFVVSNGGLHYLPAFIAIFVFSHALPHAIVRFSPMFDCRFMLVFQGKGGFFSPSGENCLIDGFGYGYDTRVRESVKPGWTFFSIPEMPLTMSASSPVRQPTKLFFAEMPMSVQVEVSKTPTFSVLSLTLTL